MRVPLSIGWDSWGWEWADDYPFFSQLWSKPICCALGGTSEMALICQHTLNFIHQYWLQKGLSLTIVIWTPESEVKLQLVHMSYRGQLFGEVRWESYCWHESYVLGHQQGHHIMPISGRPLQPLGCFKPLFKGRGIPAIPLNILPQCNGMLRSVQHFLRIWMKDIKARYW